MYLKTCLNIKNTMLSKQLSKNKNVELVIKSLKTIKKCKLSQIR